MNAAPDLDALVRFAVMEARLLDDGRLEAWVDLFADDGVYWMPSEPAQASPDDTLSLFHETKPLLRLRARRLAHPQTHVQDPPARTHRHLGSFSAHAAGTDMRLESLLLLVEWRNGTQRLFSARCAHRLRPTPAGFSIVEKRVDLLDCDAPHRAMTTPF